MTDNSKVKTGKAGDVKSTTHHSLRSDVNTSLHQLEDASEKANKVSDAKSAATQDKLKHAAVKDQKGSDAEKSSVHKAGSDAKIAPHRAVPTINKK